MKESDSSSSLHPMQKEERSLHACSKKALISEGGGKQVRGERLPRRGKDIHINLMIRERRKSPSGIRRGEKKRPKLAKFRKRRPALGGKRNLSPFTIRKQSTTINRRPGDCPTAKLRKKEGCRMRKGEGSTRHFRGGTPACRLLGRRLASHSSNPCALKTRKKKKCRNTMWKDHPIRRGKKTEPRH